MPEFIMLIGLPGSGKSHYAELIKKEEVGDTVIISSDAIRKELFGDENDQQNSSIIFAKMKERTEDALKNGTNVVYDATNIKRKARKNLIASLPDCKKTAYLVWSAYDTCIKRDAARSRTVGEGVIKKMLTGFQPPFYDEGWDEIVIKYNSAIYSQYAYEDWMNCEHDNPHHPNTVGVHTKQVCEEAFKLSHEALNNEKYNAALTGMLVVFAAGLHDIGKKFTKSFTNFKGEKTETAHFYDHHNVGSYFAIGFEKLQDLSVEERMLVAWLVNVHMDPFFNTHYYRNLPDSLKKLVDALHQCDIKGA